ncbi:hypothetical protein KSP40_PGU012198 [Platanthera guangdongensis]|uniref:Pentatricopeptide repeat-containing protein n=1 Tax=Platanthera guangdongensis TaxID=2320717 RepID=A0ABR2M3G2_9ASPA
MIALHLADESISCALKKNKYLSEITRVWDQNAGPLSTNKRSHEQHNAAAMAIAICRRTCPAALRRLFSAQYAPPKSFSATPFRRSSPSSSLSRFSTAPFYKPTTSSHLASSSETDSSDFDTEYNEPISNFASPDLPTFLHLLSRAKSEFSTEAEALAFLRSSSLARPAEALLCSVLWELRRDWESTILVFRWSGDCVLESPWSCNLMIWAFGKQRRFDLAWALLRRMHRKSLPTRQALLIMMERYVSANETEKAIKTFHALEKFNVEADSQQHFMLFCALFAKTRITRRPKNFC